MNTDYCSDCGKFLSDEEIDEGTCQECLNTTHNQHGYSQYANAVAAWRRNKAKLRAKKEIADTVEVVQPPTRYFNIK